MPDDAVMPPFSELNDVLGLFFLGLAAASGAVLVFAAWRALK
jgi:cation transporter-like permease